MLAELRAGKNIDTVEFSVRHDLLLNHVDDYLRELAKKGAAELIE